MAASDRALTETRALRIVASVACSTDFGTFNLGTLLGPQPSESGVSSLPILLPFDVRIAEPDWVLSSEEVS